MRLLVLIVTIFLTGCTVRGNVISSQGLIEGWQHSGFKSINNDIQMLFYVENDDYLSLDETLVGVTTKDRKASMKTSIGKKPFLIRVKIETNKPNVYLQQTARLVIADQEYQPMLVKKGIDRVSTGRESYQVKLAEYQAFMAVDHTLQEIDHNWLWFEFDLKTPHPNQSFSMYLRLKDNGVEQVLTANFNPKQMGIYHH